MRKMKPPFLAANGSGRAGVKALLTSLLVVMAVALGLLVPALVFEWGTTFHPPLICTRGSRVLVDSEEFWTPYAEANAPWNGSVMLTTMGYGLRITDGQVSGSFTLDNWSIYRVSSSNPNPQCKASLFAIDESRLSLGQRSTGPANVAYNLAPTGFEEDKGVPSRFNFTFNFTSYPSVIMQDAFSSNSSTNVKTVSSCGILFNQTLNWKTTVLTVTVPTPYGPLSASLYDNATYVYTFPGNEGTWSYVSTPASGLAFSFQPCA